MGNEVPRPFNEQGMKPDEKSESVENSIVSKAKIIDTQKPESEPFREEIRERIIKMSNSLIDGVQKNFENTLNWSLQLINPKTENELKARKLAIFRELEHEWKWDYIAQEEATNVLNEAGLRLFGGMRDGPTDEEIQKAKDFLAEREMKKTGELEFLTEGHANLTLHLDNGTIQIEVSSLGYVPKYRNLMQLDEVVEFIDKSLKDHFSSKGVEKNNE